jgi:hypothetical protein
MNVVRAFNHGKDIGEFLPEQVDALKKYIGTVRNDRQEDADIQNLCDLLLRQLKKGEVDKSKVSELSYRSSLSWGAKIEADAVYEKIFPRVQEVS